MYVCMYVVDEPLLSKERFKKKQFLFHSSKWHTNCPPENVLCGIEEEKFWSPAGPQEPIFIAVLFPQNVFIRAIEVRGQ